MIKDKVEEAVAYFEKGFVCSQAVLVIYAESLGLKPEIALPIADAFGLGMGGMAETCGAVTGAFMVIGLKYGRVHADDAEAKEKTRRLIKEFVKQFKNRHGSITCKTLLDVDISTDDGMKAANEKGLFEINCLKFVRDTVEILENLID
ncbi:MAG: C-GCAxxG-C-C family protein [Candidatus Aminicenantes bacterium]|jgi:C_GCAxxG_C_C family probable redox protein